MGKPHLTMASTISWTWVQDSIEARRECAAFLLWLQTADTMQLTT